MDQTDQQHEAAAVMEVVARESEAFWNKDFAAWAECWLHTPYIRTLGWWARGGIRVVEGWDTMGTWMQELMHTYPEPNPTAARVRREKVNLQVHQDMAWVTFDQYGEDTGEAATDMPGVSHETRILEKHNGTWKLVYSGWLLTGHTTE